MLLDTLQNSVTPQAFLAQYMDECPAVGNVFSLCGIPVTAVPGGFVTDAENSFVACSIVEARAMMLKAHNMDSCWEELYEKAIRDLISAFKNSFPENMKEHMPIKATAKEAARRRDIFNLCVCCGRAPSQAPGGAALAAHKLFGGRIIKGMNTILTKDEMTRLASVSGCKLKKAAAIVVPYFLDVHTVAGADIIYSITEHETVWFLPCRFAVTGLPLIRPGKIYVQEASPELAITDTNLYGADKAFYFAIKYANTGADKPVLPQISYYVRRTNNLLELIGPSLLQKNGTEVFVIQSPEPTLTISEERVPWEFCVADELLRELRTARDIPQDAEILLNTVRSNDVVRNMIVAGLKEADNFRMVEHMYAVMKGGAIWEEGGSCVYDTNNGYLWEDEKNKAYGGAMLSNFTVKPLQRIRYENGEVFVRMTVAVRGEERNVVVNASSMDTAKKFADSVATYMGMLPDAIAAIPAVYDATRFRPVLVWLARAISGLPALAGTSYLGWNPQQSVFRGAGWVASKDGITEHPMLYNPSIQYLKHFSADPVAHSTTYDLEKVNPQLARVIHLSFGLMMRAFANREITCPMYSDDRDTREALKGLFAGLGQVSIVKLNKNMRDMGALDCMRGYPAVGTGYNPQQATACSTGMILVGEAPTRIEGVKDYEISYAGEVFLSLLKAAVSAMCVDCIDVELAPGKPSDEVVEEEGKKFLLDVTSKLQ